MTTDEWEQGGFAADAIEDAWLLSDREGQPVAAASLSTFDGVPADVGVITGSD